MMVYCWKCPAFDIWHVWLGQFTCWRHGMGLGTMFHIV